MHWVRFIRLHLFRQFSMMQEAVIFFLKAHHFIEIQPSINLDSSRDSLDVRNAGQLESPLGKFNRLPRLTVVVWAILTAPLDWNSANIQGVGPMRGALSLIESTLLSLQLLLTGICRRHIAGVNAKSRGVAGWAEVIVRAAAVPDEKVAWLCVELLPLAAFVLEPFHTPLREAVPFLGPGPNLIRLVLEFLVELFAKSVRTLADDQAAVIRPIWEKVNKSLETSEPRSLGILILVWPGLVVGQVSTVWEADIDPIKGHNKIFCVIDFFESTDDSGLLADVPGEGFVGYSISQAHSLLVDDG